MSFLHLLAARFANEVRLLEQARRFFVELNPVPFDSHDCVVWGAVLLGITCGALGCFVILRRQAMLGDAIGHAVLPGVCLGFLAGGTRSTPALLLGALVAGMLAAGLISLLQRTTVLKAGECMGAVFTGFYGLGIVLLKHIQNRLAEPGGSASAGLEKFLFGQIVGISLQDLLYMAAIAAVALGGVVLAWRALAVSSFDEAFAFSIGIPVRWVHYLLTGLLTVAIVISIQAVGVVLVAAFLITPAAAAYLLTDRLPRMVALSAALGALSGATGAFFSLLGPDLPTGALMVLSAALLFTAAFLLSPRHGVLPRVLRLWQRRQRTATENLLRTLYSIMERRGGDDRRFGVREVASRRQESPAAVRRMAGLAMRQGWLEPSGGDPLVLTAEGLAEARRIVRNHRLWELFLTQEARLASDRVHADAEYIEHVLPPDVIRRLEQMLEHPSEDPHGRPIPRA